MSFTPLEIAEVSGLIDHAPADIREVMQRHIIRRYNEAGKDEALREARRIARIKKHAGVAYLDEARGDAMLSAHFARSEFECRDRTRHPICVRLILALESIRAGFETPVIVTSGYRSENYNRRVGGAERSLHLTGQAADIQLEGVSPLEVWEFVETSEEINSELIGLGLYRSWVHIDTRGSRARWGR